MRNDWKYVINSFYIVDNNRVREMSIRDLCDIYKNYDNDIIVISDKSTIMINVYRVYNILKRKFKGNSPELFLKRFFYCLKYLYPECYRYRDIKGKFDISRTELYGFRKVIENCSDYITVLKKY